MLSTVSFIFSDITLLSSKIVYLLTLLTKPDTYEETIIVLFSVLHPINKGFPFLETKISFG